MGEGRSAVAIVDDDVSMREAMAALVDAFGFDTLTFESAAHFLDHGRIDQFACLIVDVQMPGMSGLDLQAQLGASVPIIFVTSVPGQQARRQALEAGAIGYLSKPVDDAELLKLIRQAGGAGPGA